MKINDPHDFRGGLNKDDSPSNLPPSDYTDALNVRTLASEEQHGAGILETLQGEIELLLGVSAPITYYGESIGGDFQYSGFSEIIIGTQVWMKKNYDAEYPGSKVYDDDEDNAGIYGRLYNWHQVMSSDFCPAGWRVPTEADIDILIAELLGSAVAGGHMKEVGESHWNTPNLGADDSGGFRALPGGKFDLLFELLGDNCLLWLQDEGVPVAPVALNGSSITPFTFVANWQAVTGATGYYLDVSTSAVFAGFVAGYNNKDVGNVLLDAVGGLTPDTQYYFRVRAYNEVGASDNSNTGLAKTVYSAVLIDEDGNIYTSVIIGTQEWMVENLKTTKYADGTPIPNLTLDADWIAEDGSVGHDGAYCWYNNDIANKTPYGALYNWYAVDNAKSLAVGQFTEGGNPSVGWRVPSITDFDTLVTFLGGALVAGGKLKEVGETHWDAPNIDAFDTYGFKAVGAGNREIDGAGFVSKGTIVDFLTSDYGANPTPITSYFIGNNEGSIQEEEFQAYCGASVRCMRDVTP
jgi:uncharacterized protein (TIGR02145 family)